VIEGLGAIDLGHAAEGDAIEEVIPPELLGALHGQAILAWRTRAVVLNPTRRS
jgi:hypothetical protein